MKSGIFIRYSTIETKEAARIGYNWFLFPHEFSGDAQHQCLHLSTNTENPLNIYYFCAEWQHGKGGKLVLDDINTNSERGNGLVRLNTLKHYMVKDNSRMILMYNENEDTNEIYGNYMYCLKIIMF